MTDALRVCVELDGRPIEAGIAYFTHRGTLATSFRYSREYLRWPGAYELDPALPLYQGQHHVSGLPGAFADCAPDRWGQNLIRRRIRYAQSAAATARSRAITDVDYLTGVSDFTRQGALRFAVPDSDVFVDPSSDVPRMIELPALLRAAEHIIRDDDDFGDVKMLLAAGTATLGGARPKASVQDGHRLCIAKFPHHADRWDVMAWEKTALDLAENAGITVPNRSLQQVNGKGVLILDRFDRESGTRIGYISAMTMLQARDGQTADYLDVAEAIPERSGQPDADLAQLWRRIAFNIAVHNTDDHLRNHGFLRGRAGWLLAPAFDMNPNPELAEHRVTAIGGAVERAEELETLFAAAYAFGVADEQARAALREVFAATERWEAVAAANGIPASERNRFRAVFEESRKLGERLVAE